MGDPGSLQLEPDLSSFASIPPPQRPPPRSIRLAGGVFAFTPLFQTFITQLLTAFGASSFAAGRHLEALRFVLHTVQCNSVGPAAAPKNCDMASDMRVTQRVQRALFDDSGRQSTLWCRKPNNPVAGLDNL